MNDLIMHDPLHGSVRFEGVFGDIVARHEFQRLHMIRQLGMGNKVFPGANHTRFEHSIGVYHLAGRMADALSLPEDEKKTILAAGLLHDICHPPFSHVMEEFMERVTGKDHMGLARELIFGTVPTHMERDSDIASDPRTIAELLEDDGIDPNAVCDLISLPLSESGGIETFGDSGQSYFANKDYLHQIIHGPVDADQMDYLLRDAHYTGVAYGAIDLERILSQIAVFNGRLALRKGGIAASEGLMVSRSLMYSTVYYHKTVRIVEKMLTKAAELSDADFSEIYLMNDHDLITALIDSGGESSRLMRSVMDRRLYKKSYVLYSNGLTDDDRASLLRYVPYDARKRLECEIADAAGLDISQVVIDVPSRSNILSQIKIGKTDVLVLDDGKLRPITRYSPLAKSLQSRSIFDWSMMVAAPAEHSERVAKACREIIGISDRDRGHPLTTDIGLSFATLPAMPAPQTTDTTCDTSL